jgi:hypothetical protein
MSAHNVDPTDEAARDGAPRARRGFIQGGGIRRLISVAMALAATAAAVTLVAILVLLALPDHDGVTRAAARTHAVAGPMDASATGRRARQVAPQYLKLRQADVTISSQDRVTSVPGSFLGISTEYWALPVYERHLLPFERVLSLVHAPGGGPLILRIGGDSADHTFWDPKMRKVPSWVFKLTPRWLRRTSRVVRRVGVRLILDLNLVTDSPPIAALWAQTAETDLPRGSIVGFEIGNEPDIYSRLYWLAVTSRAKLDAGVLPVRFTASSYTRDFHLYAHMLRQIAPSVPLVGPALANPGLDANWVSRLLGGARRSLGMVSAHRYPYSGCVKPSSPQYPTITRLLSEHASAGMAQSVERSARLAHRAGLPFRLTELNSVTCGGRPGVSDTFATALWAPDALFELLRVGVDGVNVHVRENAINAAFAMTRSGLEARPLLYGLILFARTLGPDPELVHLQVQGGFPGLKVWAVRVHGDRLHVLLIDKGKDPVRVFLRHSPSGPATIQRLLAPSAGSRSGVTLDGQWLAQDGSWQGHAADQTVSPETHGYQLTIPRMSAALVDVHLAGRS